MNWSYTIIPYLIATISICVPALSQSVNQTREYTREEGMLERRTNDIIRDQRGRFWLFYDTGIQCYDGKSFTTIKTPLELDLSALKKTILLRSGKIAIPGTNIRKSTIFDPDHRTFKIFLAADAHTYYQVLDGELYKIICGDQRIDIQPATDTTPGTTKRSFHRAGKASAIQSIYAWNALIFIQTEDGVVEVCRDGRCDSFIPHATGIIGAVADEIWFRSHRRIDKYNTSLERVGIDSSGYERILTRSDDAGNTLVGFARNGQRLEKLKLYQKDNARPVNYETLLQRDNTGLNFFSEDFTQQLFIASHQGLWFHLLGDPVRNYLVRKQQIIGSFGSVVRGVVFRAEDKSVYFNREKEGLYKLRSGNLDTLTTDPRCREIFRNNINMCYDEVNDEIFGLSYDQQRNAVLTSYSFVSRTCRSDSLGFAGYPMKILNDKLWIMGRQGSRGLLQVVNPKTLEADQSIDFEKPINDFILHDDTLFLATPNGLYTYGATWSPDHQLKLTRINHTLQGTTVRYLNKIKGCVYAGTQGKGVFIFSGGRQVRHWTISNGLLNSTIAFVSPHDPNYYLVGTFGGLTIFDENYDFVRNITKRYGLPDNELNTFTICQDDQGTIFVGTINGLSAFDPHKLLPLKATYTVVIQHVAYIDDGATVMLPFHEGKAAMLPYGVDSFHIAYQIFDYVQSEKPNDLLTRSTKNSDQIHLDDNYISGHVTGTGTRDIFIMRKHPIHKTTEKLASVRIIRQSAFSKFKWILLSLALSATLLSYIIYTQRKRRQEKEQIREEKMKAEVNRFQLKALQSQMNPHFIFNALGSIQYFIHQNETEIADGFLSDFAALMRLILESSKSELISLRDELKLLKLYVKLEHLRFAEKFDYKFNVVDDIEDDFTIPPMLLQPFIENAINHGLAPLHGRRGMLQISFATNDTDDELIVVIEDNGIGRQSKPKSTDKSHKSRAMQIIQERLVSLKRSKAMEVQITIDDLTENMMPAGTRVNVVFKYVEK